VQCPVLLIHGTTDEIIPCSHSKALHSACKVNVCVYIYLYKKIYKKKIHGTTDEIIPCSHSKALHSACKVIIYTLYVYIYTHTHTLGHLKWVLNLQGCIYNIHICILYIWKKKIILGWKKKIILVWKKKIILVATQRLCTARARSICTYKCI